MSYETQIKTTSTKGIEVQVVKTTIEGENNDCTVRALAAATGSSYEDAHRHAAEKWGRENGQGPIAWDMLTDLIKDNPFGFKFTPIGDKELEYNLKHHGLVTVRKPKTYYNVGGQVKERTMTVKTLIERYPQGTYFCFVRGHVFTVKDGVIIGNQADAERLRTRLRWVFKVENK